MTGTVALPASSELERFRPMADDFAELDAALTAANLKRARTRSDFAQNPTHEAANADTVAWEAAAGIGELYLEARFEHEALEDPHGALDAILGSEERSGVRAALGAAYGFDDAQADAVAENLSRLATATDRRRVEQRRRELVDRLHQLEGPSTAH